MMPATVLLSASAPRSEPLEGFVRFENPATCRPAAELQAYLDGLLSIVSSDVTAGYVIQHGRPEVPSAYRRSFGRPHLHRKGTFYRVTISLRGRWHGLVARKLILTTWAERTRPRLEIEFGAPGGKLASVLDAVGFGVVKGARQVSDGGRYGSISVRGGPSKSRLICDIQ
jgi:hypothetical protein